MTRFTTRSWRTELRFGDEVPKVGGRNRTPQPDSGRKAVVPCPSTIHFRERRARRVAEVTLAGAIALSVIVAPGLLRGHGSRSNQAGAAADHVVQLDPPLRARPRPWPRWPCHPGAAQPGRAGHGPDEQAFRQRWTTSPTFRLSVAYANATPDQRARAHRLPVAGAPGAPAGPQAGARPWSHAAGAPAGPRAAPAAPAGRCGTASPPVSPVGQLGRQHRQRLLGRAAVQLLAPGWPTAAGPSPLTPGRRAASSRSPWPPTSTTPSTATGPGPSAEGEPEDPEAKAARPELPDRWHPDGEAARRAARRPKGKASGAGSLRRSRSRPFCGLPG